MISRDIFSSHTLFSDSCCCTLTSSFFSCRLNDVNWLKTSMSAVADVGLDRRPRKNKIYSDRDIPLFLMPSTFACSVSLAKISVLPG